ncbi:MAG: bifunctional metallophosphatase/5'-nucleotidase [Lachnospiraceae bacterium]|nr:bifunctional metallophosphatase/5'-nucleotidase [Lachnospiraceae bacterium]
MKKTWMCLLSVLMLTVLMIAGSNVNDVQAAGKQVDILFLHDLHSHVNEFATVENGKSQMMGGFAKLKTLINEAKTENPDTLVLDAGDFSMGTLVQTVFEDVAVELRMLGALDIEATTLGNHEFDYGAKGLANMFEAAMNSGDTLPELLVCNIDWEAMKSEGLTEEQELLYNVFEEYGVKEYTVIEKGDVKIAVMGVFGEDCFDCVVDCALAFENPIEAVKETVAEIEKNEDVDMLVCISHSGTWDDPEKSEDELLAKAVPQLDLIVSGHTHTKLDEPIVHGSTYIVSAAEYGKYLGNASMSETSDGVWKMDNYELITVDTSIVPDEPTQQKIDELTAQIDETYLAQFGYTQDQVLCNNDVIFATSQDTSELHTEVNLGSIMADAYAYAVENAADWDGKPVDVAVVPAGTIRDTYAVGDITVENVFNSFSLGIGEDGVPGYPLISVYLTGAELKIVAEIDASISDLMTTARLYTYGLYWNYNPNRMILNKVTESRLVSADGSVSELEDDKLYRVVTDFYSSQMLGGVTDLSYGLLSIVPKNADGTPIEDYMDAVITTEGQELKAWVAIAQYMESFEDTDGDGTANVPDTYATEQGRKVVENSKKIGDLLKNPNKYFFMIIGVVVVLIFIFVLLIVLIVKFVKLIVRKIRKKTE